MRYNTDMKISVFNPKKDFSKTQQEKLSSLGEVVYIEPPMEHPLEELKKIAEGSEIIAIDPDNFGGFEKARERLTKLMETLPRLRGVALDTTSFGWVDLEYCKKRKIKVTNVPGYSRESVAEHTLALLLCLAKRIIATDRKTQKGLYKLEMGFELRGKVLGIIGLGSIGSRTAELGKAIGMDVIAYNRSLRKQEGITLKSLDEVLSQSDALTIHLTHSDENKDFLNAEQINKMKDGVIIVNTADRELVSEKVMSEALRSGKVFGYAYEAEDLENTPLAKEENAIGIKGFGWYTREALQNLFQIWVDSIEGLVTSHLKNAVIST